MSGFVLNWSSDCISLKKIEEFLKKKMEAIIDSGAFDNIPGAINVSVEQNWGKERWRGPGNGYDAAKNFPDKNQKNVQGMNKKKSLLDFIVI